MSSSFNPKTEAMAAQIHYYASQRGWDISARELADILGVHHLHIIAITNRKGWTHRLRRTALDRTAPKLTEGDDWL